MFLCHVGAEDTLVHSLTPAQQQRLLVITKPTGPVKLLQSLHRLVDLLLAYYETVAERPRRLLLPRPTMQRTMSSGSVRPSRRGSGSTAQSVSLSPSGAAAAAAASAAVYAAHIQKQSPRQRQSKTRRIHDEYSPYVPFFLVWSLIF